MTAAAGCHFLPQDLPEPGIEPGPLVSRALAGGCLTASASWEASASQNVTIFINRPLKS